MRARRMEKGERGSVLPLVALLVLAAGGLAVGVAKVGVAANDAARARTAADAAALAGAAGGEREARQVAEANGAALVGWSATGDQVEVRARVGEATARARASAVHGAAAEGAATAAGLTPAMQAALARAGALLGRAVPITSGWRSRAAQAALWARRSTNPYPVAVPGASAHERGTAVDVPLAFVPILLGVAPQAGLCHPLPATDPVHFELC